MKKHLFNRHNVDIDKIVLEPVLNFRSDSMPSVKKRRYSQVQESIATDDEMLDISPLSTSVSFIVLHSIVFMETKTRPSSS